MNTDIERLIYSILLNLPRGLTGSEINDILRRVHEIKMTDRAVVSRCKAMIAQNLLEGATSEELTPGINRFRIKFQPSLIEKQTWYSALSRCVWKT